MARRKVFLENTRFIYRTNFAGDPTQDKYGSSTRRGNIVIPTQEQADELLEMGVNVKQTAPRDGEEEGFEPTYFMSVIVNYDSDLAQERPPKIYLVSGNEPPRLLDRETVGAIDKVYVVNVNATIEISHSKRYDKTLAYVQVMYVEQDVADDPFAERYGTAAPGSVENNSPIVVPDEDDLPFE